VPLGERAAHWLRRYLEEARPALARRPEEPAVFVGSGGRPLSLNWLSTLVGRHVRAALAGRPGSCHVLRHAMATMMLEGGADIRYIQLMLGHAQLVTTQIYTHVAIGRLQAVHATCHPYARLPVDPEDPRQ
jgi:integrase/recombinase XerD